MNAFQNSKNESSKGYRFFPSPVLVHTINKWKKHAACILPMVVRKLVEPSVDLIVLRFCTLHLNLSKGKCLFFLGGICFWDPRISAKPVKWSLAPGTSTFSDNWLANTCLLQWPPAAMSPDSLHPGPALFLITLRNVTSERSFQSIQMSLTSS